MAPEIINKIPYDYRVDIWSLGILLYELFHLEAPYKGRSLSEITKSQSRKVFTISSGVHPEAKDLIVRILKMNPAERLEMSDILNHSWVLGHLARREKNEANMQRILSARSLQIETEEEVNRPAIQAFPATTKSCATLVFETNEGTQDPQTKECFSSQSPNLSLLPKHQITIASSSSKSHTRDPSAATLEDKSLNTPTETPVSQSHIKAKSEVVNNKPANFLQERFLNNNLKFSEKSLMIEKLLESSREIPTSPKQGKSSLANLAVGKKQTKQKELTLGLSLTPTHKFNKTYSSALPISLASSEASSKAESDSVIRKLNLSPKMKSTLSLHKKSFCSEQAVKKKESKEKITPSPIPQPQKTESQARLKSPPTEKTKNPKVSIDLRPNPNEKSTKGSFVGILTPRVKQSGVKLLGSPTNSQHTLKNTLKTLKDNSSILSPSNS